MAYRIVAGQVMRTIAVTCAVMLVLCAPAHADETLTPSPTVTVSPDNGDEGGFNSAGNSNNGNNGTPGGTSSTEQSSTEESEPSLPPGHWEVSSPCDAMSSTGCQEFVGVACPNGEQAVLWSYIREADGGVEFSIAGCPSDPPPTVTTPPVDIPGEALRAFERVELPASRISLQPPGGETLVNFKTILSTQAVRHQIPVRLDQVKLDLVLEVWPSHFLWHHGDDTTQESATPGRAWTNGADVDGDGFITHVYTQMFKQAQVSVDTTWSAQFKVVGAPGWRPVDGTVTIAGETVALTVREATPELVTEPD